MIFLHLKDIFESNRIYDILYVNNKIKENINKNGNKKIYSKTFFDEEYEWECINIFFSLTGNLPLLSNLLIYNEETLKEEIICFLYRMIKCKYNCLFMVIFQEETPNNNINEEKINRFFLW